jgi:hypothetical protein
MMLLTKNRGICGVKVSGPWHIGRIILGFEANKGTELNWSVFKPQTVTHIFPTSKP